MKKLLFVLALGAFAACGGGTSNTNTTDSTATDTSNVAPMDTSSTMPADTSHADTTHK
ncbi:MAG TPA: hypothetical protein VN958_13385 [Chitinophagaceae bacterium]|nr:hypothetical protein [Chitinophagaceae bacterium]